MKTWMMHLMMSNIVTPDWPAPLNVKAIQTTRRGGFSQDPAYAEFNLSDNVVDHPSHVTQNHKHLHKSLSSQVYWLNQVHGVNIIDLPNNNMFDADGAYTSQEKVICAVRTADCLPILLTDDKGSFVSAIHAGWKGLGLGIIESAIKKINVEHNIIAWLGPCIGKDKFEVGQNVFSHFVDNDPSTETTFKACKGDKFLLDLVSAAHIKLKNLGIVSIYGNGITQDYCTYQQADTFFSYRRDKDTGRMATLVWIDNN